MKPSTIAALACSGAVFLLFIYYVWKEYRLRKAEHLHASEKIDFSHITEEDEREYPDRAKGIVLLVAAVASLIGFFIFFTVQQKTGFLNSKSDVPTTTV